MQRESTLYKAVLLLLYLSFLGAILLTGISIYLGLYVFGSNPQTQEWRDIGMVAGPALCLWVSTGIFGLIVWVAKPKAEIHDHNN